MLKFTHTFYNSETRSLLHPTAIMSFLTLIAFISYNIVALSLVSKGKCKNKTQDDKKVDLIIFENCQSLHLLDLMKLQTKNMLFLFWTSQILPLGCGTQRRKILRRNFLYLSTCMDSQVVFQLFDALSNFNLCVLQVEERSTFMDTPPYFSKLPHMDLCLSLLNLAQTDAEMLTMELLGQVSKRQI